MSLLNRILFEPAGGMFREFVGINAFIEPKDSSLYEKLLPKPFVIPKHMVVEVFIADYINVFPWPMSRYQEWAVLLKCMWGDREGWYVVTMPVTKWVPMKGGRYLGFPKYIADTITLTRHEEGWKAQSRYKNGLQLSIDFQPGPTQLAPWERELLSNKAFFKGDIYLLVPPGQGLIAQRVKLDHAVPAQWSPEIGTVRIEIDQHQPWAGLVPNGRSFPGTYTHFTGGINLIAERLN